MRQSGTAPELAVRATLDSLGIEFATNPDGEPGRPDIWVTTPDVPIFVHGCFWHRHEGCKRSTIPKRNREFWIAKFQKNKARDARILRQLEDLGHPPIVVWQCETVAESALKKTLLERLGGGRDVTEIAVREEFAIEDSRLVRHLSINGVSGLSSVVLKDRPPLDLSSEAMTSIWDKSFLRGAVRYPSAPHRNRSIRVADVFCGAGGLSYGVREAIRACGLRPEITLAVDTDPVAIQVYRRNFDPTRISTQNLWTTITKSYSTRRSQPVFIDAPRLLTEELQATKGRVDILLGGPPCEGHSNSNNLTRRDDPRNKYYIVMPALAVALDAKAVIVENVPGVLHDNRGVLDTAKGLFETNGYHVDELVVDSICLGLAQTRKRHILIACKSRRSDLKGVNDLLRRPRRDLRWAIGDLVHMDSDDPWDAEAELSEVNRGRIKYLFDNDEYELPNNHRPDSHKNGHTYPSIYGRLRWNRPAGTITTGFNTPGRGRYIHPEVQRTITPHEAARIQGFPDVFEFRLIDGERPTRTSLANMIGDAVPPQIGYMAGVVALATMDLGVL